MELDTKDKLAAVHDKFIASLAGKAFELEKALSVEEQNTTVNIQTQVHKIAGSTGFYGETRIAEYATKLDKQLSDVNGDTIPNDLLKQLRQLITMLREA